MRTQAQEEHAREFFAYLVRQAEQQVRRAEVCRGYDPVSRKTLAEARAELALTIACVPA